MVLEPLADSCLTLLAQDADDLLLGELRSLHGPVLSLGRTPVSDGGVIGGQSNANSETGTIQTIVECAAIAREHGVLFHTDAAQSVGKIPTRVDDLGVDLLTMAGHKFHAPKCFGALFIRDSQQLESFIHGAGHESGRRAGTESVMLTPAP